MGALNPLFLLAGAAIAVPIYLHLFQRHETRRLSFPALRYLERTEREHARRIRLRQLLLMVARIAALLFLVGAGARLFFAGRGASHPPTAVVVVLDNSLSSGLVVGETRLLDELKSVAMATLDEATTEDRFWVVRAGEPWVPAIPGNAAEARSAIEDTEVSDAGGDLSAALERASRLLETSTFEHREIHLLTDLQATGFTSASAPAGEVPVVVWRRTAADAPRNRALTGVVVGGGLPPLEGQRTDVTVTALEAISEDDTAHVPLRLVVNERIRGAATLPPGAQTTVALPPSGSGWVEGYADADPDALRADDRRYFSFRSRPAPAVGVSGDPGVFVREALAVLEGAGRIRSVSAAEAEVLFAPEGVGLERRLPGSATLVIPPSDPTLLPALNRRLADAGIPWRVEPGASVGEASLDDEAVPVLEGVRVRTRYELRLEEDPPAPVRALASFGGRPWAVEGSDAEDRRYLLLASPLDATGTSLPVSTAMLRFVEWVTGAWAGAGGVRPDFDAGSHLPAPAPATHVRFPDGSEREIDGTRTVRGTGRAGFYTFLAADTVVSIATVNAPVAESRLRGLDDRELERAIGPEVIEVRRESAWRGAVFRARQGPELWWPLLAATLVLLALEALIATSGERSPLSFARSPGAAVADGND
jgi:hypothetical protein